ncbi:MAG: hypothetical protein HYU37_02925 [Acidobacteria bacterium]|nr:hypothetical protein [Acidobacteriota bacterium]
MLVFAILMLSVMPLAAAYLTSHHEWTADGGVRAEGGVPYALRLADGRIRLYYCGPGGIPSALSDADGLDFVAEAGVRIAQEFVGNEAIVCDPTVIRYGDGLRMYYKGQEEQGPPWSGKHRVFTASSNDGGLTWVKEGMVIDGMFDGIFAGASAPEAIVLEDGRVRLYYVTGNPREGQPHGVASALSGDGLLFELEEPGIYYWELGSPDFGEVLSLTSRARPGGRSNTYVHR